MAEVWGVLGALLVIVAPLLLAAWLLGRTGAARHRAHGKMPDSTGDRPHAD